MGNRLHVASKYSVIYDEFGAFNHQVGDFHDLLYALGIYCTGEKYDECFEVYKDDWKQGIDELKSFETLDEYMKEDVEQVLNRMNYTREQIIEIFEQYLKQADPDVEYLHFMFY